MTVQELIDALQKVEDKSKIIYIYSYDDYSEPTNIAEDKNDIVIS